MPRLNVLGTFEELENTNAYSKFKLRPKRRFHYLHITAEVINEIKTSFTSISILIKNYRVHHLLAISTLITTLTEFYGFRVIWVIKRHPMEKPSTITEEHKDAYGSRTKLSKEGKTNGTTTCEVRINLNQPLMDINKDSSDIDIEGNDSIYEHEDVLSSLEIINGKPLDMDGLEEEDIKSNSSYYTEDLDNIWFNIEPSSPTHKDEQDNQSINHQLIDKKENSNVIKSTQDGKVFELDEIEQRTDEMDELSPRDYELNPIQTKANSNEIQKNENQQAGERHVPSLVPPIPPEDHTSLAIETSSSLSVEISTPRYNGTDSSVSENKNTPNIDLYLVLDSSYQLNIEELNKIMEQPFKQINYSVDTFDRIHHINEVGIDENDYGLITFIE